MEAAANNDKGFVILLSIFIGCITIASVLANKIITVFGLNVPAGVLAYSVTFVCTDVISEVWGKERANQAVFGGFIALLCVLVLIQLSLLWPKAPFWENEVGFKSVLGSTSRIIVASFVAYLVSQYHDVWAFHLWKRVTNNKFLWLRNNLSSIVSQFLDSIIFITIAFYGQMPIWPMIIGQWLIKCGIAAIDTPFVYGLVLWMNRKRSDASTCIPLAEEGR